MLIAKLPDDGLYVFSVLFNPGPGTRPNNDGKVGFGTHTPGYPLPTRYGTGSVDQFMIWNRELSDVEITSVYNQQV